MKKFFSIFVLLIVGIIGFSQVPGTLNYQAVIRDGSGNLITNTSVNLRFTITDGSNDYYQETQTVTTDDYGVVNVKVGDGIPESGTWSAIDWSASGLGLKPEVQDGSSWVDLGTSVFSSVPFSNKSAEADFANTANFADSATAAPHLPIAMGYISADNTNNTATIESGYGISSVSVYSDAGRKYIILYTEQDFGSNPIIIITPKYYYGEIIMNANFSNTSGKIFVNAQDVYDLGTDIIHDFFIVIYKGE